MPFSIVNTDIQKLEADVIVNPLYQRCFVSEDNILKIFAENIVLANRNNSYGKYIIYTKSLDWNASNANLMLFQSYYDSFAAAFKADMHSVAVPLISSDMLNIPDEEILKTTLEAMRQFLLHNEMDIFLITDRKRISVPNMLSWEIEQYIRDNQQYPAVSASLPDVFYDMEAEHCALHEEYEERKEKRNFHIGSVFKSAKAKQCDAAAMAEPEAADKTVLCIDELLASKEETFSKYLLRLIDESGMTDSEVYKKANIDRKHFSKIRSDENYKPKKQTVIAFAIALKLDIKETKQLLEKAGYALSRTMEYDLIARFFIEKQIYDMYTFECVLYQYNLI
ncbi:MAG: hypothetical protein IJ035_01475 [Oscillospiraceae bacterium]|nr:hypothetical protein [Oscillospiraceae bacterium]